MARTTLDLDPSVLSELRERAARQKSSMGAVASQILARGLAEPDATDPPQLNWYSKPMGRPRVDLEDKDAVQAALDTRT